MLSSDDPRLTAFALGELDGDERAWIAAAVAQSPELQSAVEEIRRTADELTAALATEPLPEVDALPWLTEVNGHHRPHAAAPAVPPVAPVAPRDTIVPFPVPVRTAAATPAQTQVHGSRPAAATTTAGTSRTATPTQPGYAERSAFAHRRREPRLSYFWVMTLSAACFMLVVFVSERRFSAEEEAAAARAAEVAATERARAAAAGTRRPFVELDLHDDLYARATLPTRPESEAERANNSYLPAEHRPTSSFPIDVATTSYGDVVRAIAARQLPPAGAVRIEEMLNTFAYDYPEPAAGDGTPFAASLEAADAPWAPGHRLVRIGLKGRNETAGEATAIARNVSIEVQFNSDTVRAYRLIGYEKSPLVAQDTLSAGRVDAAEVQAGHTVTALYEVIPVGALTAAGEESAATTAPEAVTRLLTVRIAYTRPDGVAARPLEFPLDDRGASFGDASGDFKFAAAVAGFGMKLSEPGMNDQISFGSIIAWAEQGARNDRDGLRQKFVGLVRDASLVAQ